MNDEQPQAACGALYKTRTQNVCKKSTALMTPKQGQHRTMANPYQRVQRRIGL